MQFVGLFSSERSSSHWYKKGWPVPIKSLYVGLKCSPCTWSLQWRSRPLPPGCTDTDVWTLGVYVWHFTWLLKCFCLPDLIKAKSQSGQSGCLADSIWWRSGCWCWWSVFERQCRDCGGGVYLCRPPKPVRVEKGIQAGYAGYTERYTGWRRQNKQPMKGSFCFRNRTQQSHRRLWDLRSTLLIFKDEKQAQIRVGFLEEEKNRIDGNKTLYIKSRNMNWMK